MRVKLQPEMDNDVLGKVVAATAPPEWVARLRMKVERWMTMGLNCFGPVIEMAAPCVVGVQAIPR